MDEANAFNIYSLAFILEMPLLLKQTEFYITESILNNRNAIAIYIEGLRVFSIF